MLSSVPASKTNGGENRAGNVSWWERDGNATQLGKTESEENIVEQRPAPLEIWASKQFDVDRESVAPGSNGMNGSPAVMIHGGGVYEPNQYTSRTTIITTVEPKERKSADSK